MKIPGVQWESCEYIGIQGIFGILGVGNPLFPPRKIEYNLEQQPETSSNTFNKLCLVDFVYIYFRRRFSGDEILQLERSYNLAASC